MYGTFLGDIVGSPYEFNKERREENFPLFSQFSRFTDDTVMTTAIAEALMNANLKNSESIKKECISSMQK